jgi:hypothetical protein
VIKALLRFYGIVEVVAAAVVPIGNVTDGPIPAPQAEAGQEDAPSSERNLGRRAERLCHPNQVVAAQLVGQGLLQLLDGAKTVPMKLGEAGEGRAGEGHRQPSPYAAVATPRAATAVSRA